jgi:predicted permease
MESMLQDIRFAVRSLRKAPGFTLIAVLTLALGIGANTAIFSLVNAVLLRPPAHVESPEELVSIFTSDYSGGDATGMNSRPDFEDFRASSSAIEDAVAVLPGVVNLSDDDGISQILISEFVTGNYFEMLGVRLTLGRSFSPEEGDYTSGQAVAVLSHGLWTRRFGAAPGVVGTTFRASGQTVTVIGVAPEGFTGSLPLIEPELWMPDATTALIQGPAAFENRGARGFMIRARLADGATIEQAQEQLTALAPRLQEGAPGNWTDVNGEVRRVGVVEDSALPPQIRTAVRGFAVLLLSVVGIVLLIACANVANLTLARASQRGREMAIRVSMGAGRSRVVRQLLTESVIVGVVGGIAGALFAVWVMRFAETFRPMTGVAVSLDLGVDRSVLLFSALVTMVTIAAVGLAPAWKASRPDLVSQLKEGGAKGSGPFRWHELRHLLVVSQVSASLLLLVGAGLFLKSLRAAVTVDPGFQVEGMATLSMSLGPEGYTNDEALELFALLEDRAAGLPGVQAATTVDALPMTLMAGRRTDMTVVGYVPSEGEDMEFQFHSVGPGYMETMGTEMLLGREFDDGDRLDGQFVAMVNETLADRFWPGESPIGKSIVWGGTNEAVIVGLVADAMYRDLRDVGRPAFFLPIAQNPATSLTLVARTDPDRTNEVMTAMRAEVAAIDRTLPISSLQTLEDAISFTLLPQRIAGWLLSLAGGLGLLLATVGLYGVMSFLVSQRTREVAVRMAIGAEARDVIFMVVRRGLVLAGLGAVVGLALAAVVTRFAQTLLFGVSPLDMSVFVVMALAALLVSGFASWVPARRAAHVDPMQALRQE